MGGWMGGKADGIKDAQQKKKNRCPAKAGAGD